ncbi:universal stress protein [Oceanisphaera sp. KMM 10153]|uniref:universal stress protein n=1 Tax=Oceanisphaera submarina TaxID=3390193 RepID=UPI0039747B42
MTTSSPRLFRHLLVALDDSEEAGHALETAAGLAQHHGCRLTLVSVYRHFSYTNSRYTQIRVGPIDTENPVDLSLKYQAEEVLARARSRLRQRRLEANYLLRRGAPTAVIIALAEQLNVDAIVMGSGPRGNIPGRLLGSIADKISAQAHCSCIRVRRPRQTIE